MKIATPATLVTLTAGLTTAQLHGHSHRYVHKRAPPVDDTVITVYELNGNLIPAAEVAQGIKNGSLVMGTGSAIHPATSAKKPKFKPPTNPVSIKPTTMPEEKPAYNTPPLKIPGEGTSTTPSVSPDDLDGGNATGVQASFPDGQIECSTFPSQYGAVAVDWTGLGGWTGIQSATLNDGAFSNIMTISKAQCFDGSCCAEGDYCSYACPAGYQKSQWPFTQGATGQSVGGILCKGGKLYLTNPSLSRSLCVGGTNKVIVQVKNTMNQNAAVCRTDYPGTEGETIPLDATPGSVLPLTCPDAADYFQWAGSSTSAQYYANPAGVPVSSACQWGSSENNWGNFAPINLGVGYSNGAAWLSIFQNLPTTNSKLDYTIELVGNNGGFDNFIGRCKYSNGQYCSGDDYSACSSEQGCTVRVASGTATYVFST